MSDRYDDLTESEVRELLEEDAEISADLTCRSSPCRCAELEQEALDEEAFG